MYCLPVPYGRLEDSPDMDGVLEDRCIDLANPSQSSPWGLLGNDTSFFMAKFLFPASSFQVVVATLADPLKVMISGAPASGKGTQCELIKTKVSDLFMNSLVCYCIMSYNPPVQRVQSLAAVQLAFF
jgi:hypothetical protein